MDDAVLPDVSGWTVTGRHGPLGRVVPQASAGRATESQSLLVRGGKTHVLYFHVPVALVTHVMQRARIVQVDADIADFSAHLRQDGSIDLFPALT